MYFGFNRYHSRQKLSKLWLGFFADLLDITWELMKHIIINWIRVQFT